MNVFITGGCGFIGSNLVEFHLNKGDEVLVLDNLSSGSLKNIAPFQNNTAFQFSEGDLLNWPGLLSAVRWADRIYNLAAIVGVFKAIEYPLNTITTGIIGCHHLLETVAESGNFPKILIASSSSVYGDNPKDFVNEEDHLETLPVNHPLEAYAISKLSDEALGRTFHKATKIPIYIPRIFNTIGPRQISQYGMVVPRFVKQAQQGENLTVFGDGNQTRSFCDVRDLVMMLDLLMENESAIGQVVNVGNDKPISINGLADLVGECLGTSVEKEYIPYSKVYGEEYRDIRKRCPDLSKLRGYIDYQPQWTLKQTVFDLLNKH